MEYHTPIPNVPMFLTTRRFPKPETWVPIVEAWEPVYLYNYGNACLLYLENGLRMYLGTTSLRIFRIVAAFYAIDVPEMRKHFTSATSRSQSIPLAISARKLVLFAYKSRCPDIKNDGAVAYVADRCIEKLEPSLDSKRELYITLKSGHVLTTVVRADHFAYLRRTAGFFLYYLHTNKILPLL